MAKFKTRAADHLKTYVTRRGIAFKEHSILADKDAIAHQFFDWPGMRNEIERRRKFAKKNGDIKAPYKNMLRSEHIPYNLFVPLKLSSDESAVLAFFRTLLDRKDILKLTKFEIEWAPESGTHGFTDKTSFDTYIEFSLPESRTLGVGIEVKYTEKSYPFTPTEKLRLETKDESSPYYKIWKDEAVSIYSAGSYEELGKKKHKQFLRNHLLGLSMIRSRAVNEFMSVLIYPAGNEYQARAAESYAGYILQERQDAFKVVSLETFIKKGKTALTSPHHAQWLEYLQERYIIN